MLWLRSLCSETSEQAHSKVCVLKRLYTKAMDNPSMENFREVITTLTLYLFMHFSGRGPLITFRGVNNNMCRCTLTTEHPLSGIVTVFSYLRENSYEGRMIALDDCVRQVICILFNYETRWTLYNIISSGLMRD